MERYCEIFIMQVNKQVWSCWDWFKYEKVVVDLAKSKSDEKNFHSDNVH